MAPLVFLHTALTLPARTPRDIFAVCDPVRALTPEEQPVLHEDLSEVQGGDRFGRIELRLRRAGPGRYLRELVTGHSGCGKSTELLRLASALRVPKDGAAFHVVYVDANASLSPHEARLPQLLVALLAALAEEPRWDLRATRSGPPLWERFRRIVGGLGDAAGELANAAGFPQLRALLKIDLNLARGFRKAAQDHLQSLIAGTQDLIGEVTRALPPEQGAIVFILDNLEKIPEGETEGGVSVHEALFSRELPLLEVPAHLVLTYPIALNYGAVELSQRFAHAIQTTIPMVGVRAKPEITPRGDDPRGIAALRRLLARRVALEAVFDGEQAITELVRLSGGCVHDLLRIMGELPSFAEPPYSIAHVREVGGEISNQYERMLQGKPFLGLLHAIDRTGEFPADTQDAWKRQMLMSLTVLEYDTGTWYDVHPLVKATRAFRSAAPAR